MPEANSNSTVTIPGGITQNDILDSLSAADLLSALTGGTVTAGDGSAINNNTYYQPVTVSQDLGGRSVQPLIGKTSDMSFPDLLPLSPVAAMPALPSLQRASTVPFTPAPQQLADSPSVNPLSASGSRGTSAPILQAQRAQYADPRNGQPLPNNENNDLDSLVKEFDEVRQGDLVRRGRRIYYEPQRQQQGLYSPPAQQGLSPADIQALKQQGVDEFLRKQSESPAGPIGKYFTPEALERQQAYQPMTPRMMQSMANNQKPGARFLSRLAGGLNSNIAARQAAEAKAKWNVISKAVEADSQMMRRMHEDVTKLQKAAMDNDTKMQIAQLEAKGKGALTHSQAHSLARESLKTLDPRIPSESELLTDTLIQAEAVTGFPYTKYMGMKTKEGAVEATKNQAEATKAVIAAGQAAFKAANAPKEQAMKERQAEATYLDTIARTKKSDAQTDLTRGNMSLIPGKRTLLAQAIDKNNIERPGVMADAIKKQYETLMAGNKLDRQPVANELQDNALALSNAQVDQIPNNALKNSANTLSAVASSLVDSNTVDDKIALSANKLRASDQRLVLNDQAMAAGRRKLVSEAMQQAKDYALLEINSSGEEAAIYRQAKQQALQKASQLQGEIESRSPAVANAFDYQRAVPQTEATRRILGAKEAPATNSTAQDSGRLADEAAKKKQALALINKWQGESAQQNDFQRQAAINLNERGLKFRNIDQAKAAIKAETKRLQAQARKNAGLSPDALAMVNGIHAAARGRKLFNLSTDDSRPLEIYSPLGDRKTKGTNMVRFNEPLN